MSSLPNEHVGTPIFDASEEDHKVLVSGADTTPDFLFPKLEAGANVTLTITNPGLNERVRIDVAAAATLGVLEWGTGNIATTATPRFLYPGYEEEMAQTIAIQFRIPVTGTLRNLRVRHNVTGTTGAQSITYTVRVNNLDTLLAVTMAPTAVDGSNLVNTAAVVAGDLIDIRVTKPGGIATSPQDIMAVLELAA